MLADRERNGYHDSDFYAIYWDEEDGRVKSVEYGTTRFPSPTWCEVDATPDVIEKAVRYTLERALILIYGSFKIDQETLKIGHRGHKVRVIAGRKVPLGTEGYVVAVKPNPYDKWNPAVVLQGETNMHYTYANNVEIVEAPEISPEELAYRARSWARNEMSAWQVDWSDAYYKLVDEIINDEKVAAFLAEKENA